MIPTKEKLRALGILNSRLYILSRIKAMRALNCTRKSSANHTFDSTVTMLWARLHCILNVHRTHCFKGTGLA
jgi:hypothetical protein